MQNATPRKINSAYATLFGGIGRIWMYDFVLMGMVSPVRMPAHCDPLLLVGCGRTHCCYMTVLYWHSVCMRDANIESQYPISTAICTSQGGYWVCSTTQHGFYRSSLGGVESCHRWECREYECRYVTMQCALQVEC
ncbi:unnamed protein product [Periconia digitata]|uniref:Uncharacterized protein n=1 Tax=Periconia digitata TaxID=1303443 RepID=A0A9W4XGI5_9PLEO|nr:unnamed protein product [Periconia digitata]